MTPKTISHYRILHKLGSGGMCGVFLVDDSRLRREVALKILPENLAIDGEQLRRVERKDSGNRYAVTATGKGLLVNIVSSDRAKLPFTGVLRRTARWKN